MNLDKQHGPRRGKHPSRSIRKMGKRLRKKRIKIEYLRWLTGETWQYPPMCLAIFDGTSYISTNKLWYPIQEQGSRYIRGWRRGNQSMVIG